MPRVPGSVPAHRAELFAEFLSYLERTGRCYILYQEAARQFLVRWPDIAAWPPARWKTGSAVMCTSGPS